MTVDELIAELQNLLRFGVVGPRTPIKIDRGASEAVPLHRVEHTLQIAAPPFLKLS